MEVSIISELDNITEYAMNLDSFLNPTTYKGRSAVEILICRLILLEPGTIETHPDMGVGIASRFRHMSADNLVELNQEIQNQITTYLPQIYAVDVQTSIKKQVLQIKIKANDEFFALTYSPDSNSKLAVQPLSLNDIT